MQVLTQRQIKAESKQKKLEQLESKERNQKNYPKCKKNLNEEKQLPLTVGLLSFQTKLGAYIETIQSTLDKQQRLLSTFSVLSLYEIEEMNQKDIFTYYHHLLDKLEQLKVELKESLVSQTDLEKFLEQNLQEIKAYVNLYDSEARNKKRKTKKFKIQTQVNFDDETTQDYLCQDQDQKKNMPMPIKLNEISNLMKPFTIYNHKLESFGLMVDRQSDLSLQKFEQNIAMNTEQTLLAKSECLTFLDKMFSSHSLFNQAQYFELPSIETLLQRGYSLERVSDYHSALQVYDQVLQRNSYNIKALCRKGDCLRILDQYSDSLRYYEQVLMLNEYHVDSLLGKGYALGLLQQYEEALKYVEKALVINPNNADIIWAKGEILRLLGQYELSLVELDKGLVQNPFHVYSLCSKGECLRNLGYYEEAAIYLDSAISLNPLYLFALGCKGLIYLNLEKYQIAKQFFKQSLCLNPNYESFRQALSNYYIEFLEYCEEMLQFKQLFII